ncbi:helix-turn-helix domain-containing protein [Nocardioides daejeonensis]|uniref:helix-turn-helix domain-containing protein n=1 Tax=Nocardioides daejeonensis TaxID=1046556 RepID=UPI000D74017D|nr:helix-turn-helix transcriptional regulator [Nocardioides daejeonensis]
MDRLRLVGKVLDLLAEGRIPAARDAAERARQADPSAADSLLAVASFWTGDFDSAFVAATRAVGAADDEEARALALVATALACSGLADRRTPDDPVTAAVDAVLACSDDTPWWALMRYLATEAALVSARLDEAARVQGPWRHPAEVWADRPSAVLMAACWVRLAAFRGRIADATDLLPGMHAAGAGNRLETVAEAVDCLVLGNADHPDAMAGRDRVLAALPEHPSDWVDRGVLLLLAFGAIATGDPTAAAGLVFRAGGDEALTRCTLIDRGLGLELLLVAALLEEDEPAAAVWAAHLAELVDTRIVGPTADRALSRFALARGAVDEAIERAERSIRHCRAQDRVVEAAEGEIVLARARIARHDVAAATKSLRAVVAAADGAGHVAVRRSASETLGAVRRRLPPVAGGGWAVLSAREAEVARQILAGADLGSIAESLFLSPHTVRTHASRVLCAFGAPTRIGLLAVAGPGPGEASMMPPAPLSARQDQVAALIAQGRSNAQVATELEISVKAVEKHIGDIRVRWQATSRFDVARLWWATRAASP